MLLQANMVFNTSDKSVYNVRVIDQKTIASRASQNLADLLTNELNTQLTQDNILGTRKHQRHIGAGRKDFN